MPKDPLKCTTLETESDQYYSFNCAPRCTLATFNRQCYNLAFIMNI